MTAQAQVHLLESLLSDSGSWSFVFVNRQPVSLCHLHGPAIWRMRQLAPKPMPAHAEQLHCPAAGFIPPLLVKHSLLNAQIALCQVLAAGAAAAPAPAPASTDALPCPAPGAAQPSLLGSYRALDPQAAPALAQQLAPLAWQAYAGRSALGACPAGSAKLASASVQRACQQARVTGLC